MTLFWLVVLTAGRIRDEFLLVCCIPAVFVAIVMGFSMGIYAWDTWGTAQALLCPVLAWCAAHELVRRHTPRDLVICLYLTWAVGLVGALIATGFPDAG